MDVRSHVPGPEHSAHPCQHCPVTSGVLPVRGYGQFGDNVLIKKLLEDKEQKGGKAGKSWKDCQAVGLAALSEPFPCKLFPMNRAGKPVGALPVAAALQMLLGWDPAGCGGQPPPQGFGGRGPQALAVGCGPQNRGEAPKEKCLLPWDTGRPDTPPCCRVSSWCWPSAQSAKLGHEQTGHVLVLWALTRPLPLGATSRAVVPCWSRRRGSDVPSPRPTLGHLSVTCPCCPWRGP